MSTVDVDGSMRPNLSSDVDDEGEGHRVEQRRDAPARAPAQRDRRRVVGRARVLDGRLEDPVVGIARRHARDEVRDQEDDAEDDEAVDRGGDAVRLAVLDLVEAAARVRERELGVLAHQHLLDAERELAVEEHVVEQRRVHVHAVLGGGALDPALDLALEVQDLVLEDEHRLPHVERQRLGQPCAHLRRHLRVEPVLQRAVEHLAHLALPVVALEEARRAEEDERLRRRRVLRHVLDPIFVRPLAQPVDALRPGRHEIELLHRLEERLIHALGKDGAAPPVEAGHGAGAVHADRPVRIGLRRQLGRRRWLRWREHGQSHAKGQE